MLVSIIISNHCQQTHPESWELGLEPVTLSSLWVMVTELLMIYSLSGPLNLTVLTSWMPSLKRVKYHLCSFTLPN